MKTNKSDWGILWRVILLLITLLAFSFTLLKELYFVDLVLLPVIVFQVIDFYSLHKKTQEEVTQFVESIHSSRSPPRSPVRTKECQYQRVQALFEGTGIELPSLY